MSAAHSAAEWSEMFVATAGAAAVLAGLLFVAVSINVDRILAFAGLPERALEALLILLGVVVVSVLCLAPGIDSDVLGWLLLAQSVVLVIALVALLRRSLPHREGRSRGAIAGHLSLTAAGTLPFLVGAISMIGGSGGGLYWVLGGIVGAFTGTVLNAWVLLVEILR